MALARLLADWAGHDQIAVHGLTVDHQLRDAAAVEAAQVGAWLSGFGIPHTVLEWVEGRTARSQTRSVQSAAREARYRLMTEWCAARGFSHLFVAHHADDQVETFLLRLSRGSGVDGLAAMAPQMMRDGIVVARPLLGFTKSQLVAVCRARAQSWIDDPSNQNLTAARVRFRQAQQVLEREGLTRARLLATVGHMQRARAALDYAVAAMLDRGSWDDFGVARLPVADLAAAPEEIALRGLARMLTGVGGQDFGPRFESLVRLHRRLTAGPWTDATLHGCFISRIGADVTISREPAQVTDEKTLSPGSSVVWDGRFRLTRASDAGADFSVARLSKCGDVPASHRALLAEVPFRVRLGLPALFDFQGLVAVPHIRYTRADIAATPGFALGLINISGDRAAPRAGDADL